MLNKTLSILSLLLLEVASTMLLVRPAGAAVVWGTVVDTESAPGVDAIVLRAQGPGYSDGQALLVILG